MRKEIQLETVIQQAMSTLKASMYVSLPGAIVDYDPATQTASVQPMLTDPRTDLSDGSAFFEPWGILQHVPVMWPRAAGFVIAGFLQPKDQIVLEAFDLDPTAWKAQGRSLSAVNPGDLRRLGGQFWRVNPCDLTSPGGKGVNKSAPTTPALVIGQDGGPALITISSDGTISLGSGATSPVALATLVATELGKIATAISALHGTYTPGSVAATVAKAL